MNMAFKCHRSLNKSFYIIQIIAFILLRNFFRQLDQRRGSCKTKKMSSETASKLLMPKSIKSFWKRNGIEKLENKMVSGFFGGCMPF